MLLTLIVRYCFDWPSSVKLCSSAAETLCKQSQKIYVCMLKQIITYFKTASLWWSMLTEWTLHWIIQESVTITVLPPSWDINLSMWRNSALTEPATCLYSIQCMWEVTDLISYLANTISKSCIPKPKQHHVTSMIVQAERAVLSVGASATYLHANTEPTEIQQEKLTLRQSTVSKQLLSRAMG